MLKRSLDCLHSHSSTAESAKTGKPLRPNSKQPRNTVQADCPDAAVRELLRQITMMLHSVRNRSDTVRSYEIQNRSKRLRDLNCHRIDRVRRFLQRGFFLKSLPRIRERLRLFRLVVLHVLHLLHVLADAEDVSLLTQLRGKDDRCPDAVNTRNHFTQPRHFRSWNSRKPCILIL